MRVPAVGFDLDLTLIDTVPGFAACLDALADELGVALPSAELCRNLGPPLDLMLAPYLPATQVSAAVDRFRALYPDHAIEPVPLLPGAVDAVAAVREAGFRVLVVTGKFTPNAARHLAHVGLEVDALVGEVWGAGKGAALQGEGALAYVGDHVHDVEGARAAGVCSVSVLTGGCTRAELEAAGTDVVLEDLTSFRRWWSTAQQDLSERGCPGRTPGP